MIDIIEQEQLRDDIPDFGPGDSVRVHGKVVEGGRERIQVFKESYFRAKGAAPGRHLRSERYQPG